MIAVDAPRLGLVPLEFACSFHLFHLLSLLFVRPVRR
jgi:hypothetical protein